MPFAIWMVLSVPECNTGIGTSASTLQVLGHSWQQLVPPVSPFITLCMTREDPQTATGAALTQCPPPHSLQGKEELPKSCSQWWQCLVQSSCASQSPCSVSTLIPNSDPPRLSGPRLHPGPALAPSAGFSAADPCRSRLPQRLSGRPCLWARSSC